MMGLMRFSSRMAGRGRFWCGAVSEEKPEYAYYLSYAPTGKDTLETLVRVAGQRWQNRACFETAKGECGLDHYEVRHWQGLVPTHHAGHAGPCCVVGVARTRRKKLQTRKCGSAYPTAPPTHRHCYGAGGTAFEHLLHCPTGEDISHSTL